MKSTTNVFQEGLKTDLHPLSTSQQVLTDALNATMITYNGNEMMLQNDMGNTLIQDSKTGHIMGLSEGFVPVGLKEHGGIMYVASVNKEGVGEIGTIPSPILTLSLKNVEFEDKNIMLVENSGPIQNIIPITEFKVYPGEKFLPLLAINTDLNIGSFHVETISGSKNLYDNRNIVSTAGKHDGLYQLKLYSIYDNNQVALSQITSNAICPIDKDGNSIENKYWFLPSTKYDNVDINKTYLNNQFQTYPGNIPPGKLGIKAELETVDSFGLIKITQMIGSRQHDTFAPLVVEDATNHTYQLWFPGFEYRTSSIRFIRKIEVEVTELYSGKIVYQHVFNNKSTDHHLATVEKAVGVYQIQSVLPIYKSYNIISPTEKLIENAEQYFTPLFKITDIEELDTWYQLTIKYYDQFGGYIDTYQFSFNPLHIRKYSESYYNIEWSAAQAIPQNWPESESATYTPAFTTNISGDTYNGTVGTSQGTIEGGGNQWDGYHYQFTIPISSSIDGDFTVSHKLKIPCSNYSYLWKGILTTNMILSPIEINAVVDYYLESNSEDIGASGLSLYTTGFSVDVFADTKNLGDLVFSGNSGSANDHHLVYKSDNMLQSIPITTSTIYYTIGSQSAGSGITLSGSIDSSSEIFSDIISISSGSISVSCRNNNAGVKADTFTFPAPSYSIIPYFNIIGDTDEELNISLGLTRTGQLTKAWSFEENIYDLNTLTQKDSTSQVSTFSQDASYFPSSCKINTVIVDKGVYLLNVDHMIQQGNPRCYFEVNNQEYDLVHFKTNNGFAWIAPTLIYLPYKCQFQIGWENLERLQNIGMYRVLEDIVMIDGKIFGESESIQVKYYQSSDFIEDTEIILPLEATYFEDAVCLDKSFVYYPGLSSCSHCNRHVRTSDMTKSVDADDVFTVSEYRSFIYNYTESNPLEGIIPQIEGLKGNTLTYRIENNGEN